jgi:FtsH-binding integral membrane protein
MQDNHYANVSSAQSSQIDIGLRRYMLGVYNHMTTALALTGLFAFAMKWAALSIPGVAQAVYGSPLKYVVMFAPFVLVMYLSFNIQKLSPFMARNVFYLYAALMGLSLSSILLVFTGESVARAFFVTAGAFAGLSIYGYTTKRDLTAMGSFMIIGLFGIIIASLVNIFVGSDLMQFAISVIGVFVFAGLTAWDTQTIKSMYSAADNAQAAATKSIFGALKLYLDFINMFIMLLHLFGNRN